MICLHESINGYPFHYIELGCVYVVNIMDKMVTDDLASLESLVWTWALKYVYSLVGSSSSNSR